MNATTDGSDSQEELVEFIVQSVAEFYVVNYIDLAAFAVILFDYVITFDNEVRFAWCRKYSWAKIIFLFNRYLSIASYFLSLGPLLPMSNLLRHVHPRYCVVLGKIITLLVCSCKVLNYSMETVTVLLYGVWAAFSGLRVYAISGRNWIITAIVTLLALVPVGSNIKRSYHPMKCPEQAAWLFHHPIQASGPDVGPVYFVVTCSKLNNAPVSVMTRASLMISEGIVIVVTWIKTYHSVRSAIDSQVSFTVLVLREGMLYFSVVFTLNIVQIVFIFVESDTFALILLFLNVFIPILISRWYFDLDDLKREVSSASLPSSRSDTLRFAKMSLVAIDSSTASDDIPIANPLVEDRSPSAEKKLVYL
ncbi:hypothetical protein C8Q79DRAFT_1009264 [Trametes meyenii]|nr:hypothetical protein C8Q79DRAFT_1009264 [Trametes meyenii]